MSTDYAPKVVQRITKINSTKLCDLCTSRYESSTVLVCSLLQTEVPWQWQNTVQAKLAATHPHLFDWHGCSEEHEQLTRIDSGAGGFEGEIRTGWKDFVSSFLIHPYWVGSRRGGSWRALFQIAHWKWARFTFSLNVGGREHSLGILDANFLLPLSLPLSLFQH